ncbi:MAG: zinc ribbon domain-containing protein [Dehalococcoidales bacterium]|nr:zinc ribbon domain-containing protein [Dehalococcoidales bacterium]
MPIYEYECQKCGKKFEYFHWFGGDEKQLKCPKCGDEKPQRLMSATAGGCSGGSCAPRKST